MSQNSGIEQSDSTNEILARELKKAFGEKKKIRKIEQITKSLTSS